MFGASEKEQFRTFMRMYENFSGCRVLAYCLMGNHAHVLLEVPPMKAGGLTDAELLGRLRAIYPEDAVKLVAKELSETRAAIRDGEDAALPGAVFYRSGGDWESGVCGWRVPGLSGAVWGAEDARCG